MWWQHYLLNHVGDDKTHFVAVATGGFRHSMCIPQEVGNHLGSMISETIKLEAPNGIFHIGVCRKTGELVLQSGWDKFVAMHHIEENYSFWFVYRGNSTFKVRIFNSNDHEMTTSCSQPPQSFGGVPSAATCDHHVLNGYEAHMLNERASVEFGVDLEPHSSGNLEGPSQHSYILAAGITLGAVETKKVEEKVQAIQSALPIFVTVMTKTWVNGRNLRFCREYGSRYIPPMRKGKPLMLQAEGRTTEWPARLGIDATRVNWIRRGWKEFVAGNDVREGDICLFERAKSTTRLRMTVHFLRKSDMEV
ncbi:hypothetical protein CFC21_056252 [Triticum aestivum]|uniref:TF-B3 domain-containing protein n=3 Tax=Triticum TaxID=4564 RepID=A0A9R0STM8_TRITD|nr:B3 domain-containing protein Os12g0591400-like [Triticum aestivum]KAF7047309.1 hypothetical protein CFC21_056252 [Triticum aestivum]VAI01177.1 unnamed protein product [Triticum turgidum subsp. durum]